MLVEVRLLGCVRPSVGTSEGAAASYLIRPSAATGSQPVHRLATAASLALVLALGACGEADGPSGGSDGRATSGDAELVCGDASFGEGELAAMRSLDTLPDVVLGAVDDTGEPAVDTTLDWRVAAAHDDEVVLIREFAPGEPAAAGGDTHGIMRLAPITGAPNIPDGTWLVWGHSSCSPRLADGAGDGQAELRLADTPASDDTELTLLVMERRCASGRSADGRIALDELTLTEDQVRVRVSVRPPPGQAQTCQGNPWTPYTINLGEPLGDRTVVDANLVPARELLIGTEERSFDPEPEDRDAAVERALSFDVWPDYTLLVETTCFCLAGTSEVVVRDGEVVARRHVGEEELPADVELDPSLAPSITEVFERLRVAYEEDPDSITDIAVEESGMLLHVAFDPIREAIDDEIAYRFEVDVDSPGDPVGGE